MNREVELQSLLVQVAKLQVALRHMTAQRDALKTELAEQASSQQQCLQLLLDARQQLQQFQEDLCTVRDSNQQLVEYNLRLQQQVQHLQRQQTQHLQHSQQQRTDIRQQQQDKQSLEAEQQLNHLNLLSHLAAGWHNQPKASDSSSTDSSASNSSTTGSCSSSTSSRSHSVGNNLQLDSSKHSAGLNSYDTHRQQQWQQPGISQQSLSPNWANHESGQFVSMQKQWQQGQHKRFAQQDAVRPAVTGLEAHEPDVANQTVSPVALLHTRPIDTATSSAAAVTGVPQQPSRLENSKNSASVTGLAPQQQQQQLHQISPAADADVVQLTQKQLDYILSEVALLQQQLAQTAAKLDAATPQPGTPLAQQQQQQHQQQQVCAQQQQQHAQVHHQQQRSQVPLPVGDRSVDDWYQQLELKQQQLQQRQQHLLGTSQPGQLQRRHKSKQQLQTIVNARQQRRPRADRVGQNCRVPWNYQNRQLQQAQQQRQQNGTASRPQRQQVLTSLAVPAAAAAAGHSQGELLGTSPQQQQQQHQQEVKQAQQQPQQLDDPEQNLLGVATPGAAVGATAAAAAAVVPANAHTAEAPPAAASGCLQLEGSWVSSGSSEAAVLGPARQTLVIMQPPNQRSPAVKQQPAYVH